MLILLVIDTMSSNDNLLTFLKKNSLFSSPSKNPSRKSKSRSKDNSESRHTPTRNREALEEPSRNRPQQGEYSFGGPLEPSRGFAPLQNSPGRSGGGFQDSRFSSLEEEGRVDKEIWAGLVSHTASFESARIESTHCL